MQKIPGRSLARHNGVLQINKYLRIPYSLLKSEDFIALNSLAAKMYFILLSRWKTNDPDKPVFISYDQFQEMTGAGRTQISQALKQLVKFGFIHKESRYKVCNKYWIEQKRFTGEY
jgi:hypothetical protein